MNETGVEARYVARMLATCAIAGLCYLSALLHAQVYRAGVNLVVLDVIVTDGEGRPVEDLTAEDFEVVEDGQRRPVVSTSLVRLPIHPSPADAHLVADDDVWTNRFGDEQRIFTIVIDDLNTPPANTSRARDVVRQFIERLPAGDLAAIVYTGQQTGARELTADKRRLLASLQQLTGRNPVPSQDSIDRAWVESDMAGAMRGRLQAERLANFRRTGITLRNAVAWLAPVTGRRKAVLFVTEGLPAEALSGFAGQGRTSARDDAPSLGAAFRQVSADAMHGNVAIYPVDLRGLAVPLGPGVAYRTPDLATVPDEDMGGANPMNVLANETGGIAAFNTNDFAKAFDRIVQDSSCYYLVGYESTAEPDARTPAVHRLTVKTRRPGLVVRARRGYASGIERDQTKDARDAMTRLLDRRVPGGDLSVELQATAFPRAKDGARVVVVLEIDGRALRFHAAGARRDASLTYRIAATNVYGEPKAQDGRQVHFTVSEARRHQIEQSRVRLVSQLDLPPGSYRLRAAVIADDQQGVVLGDIDVANYGKLPVALSGPLVTSSASAKWPVQREDAAPFEGRLPAVPTTRRAFGGDEAVEMYAEVHVREPATQPTLTATVLGARGQPVTSVPCTVEGPAKGLGGALTYRARAALSMRDLPQGRYLLEVSGNVARGDRAVRRIALVVH